MNRFEFWNPLFRFSQRILLFVVIGIGRVSRDKCILTDLHLLLEVIDSVSIFGASNPSIDAGSPCIPTLTLQVQRGIYRSPNPSKVKNSTLKIIPYPLPPNLPLGRTPRDLDLKPTGTRERSVNWDSRFLTPGSVPDGSPKDGQIQ